MRSQSSRPYSKRTWVNEWAPRGWCQSRLKGGSWETDERNTASSLQILEQIKKGATTPQTRHRHLAESVTEADPLERDGELISEAWDVPSSLRYAARTRTTRSGRHGKSDLC